ncbi:MAG: hypothetical protein IJB31_00320 [Akkermansia sp.]|nr:hypothetical protein [Akkermansia sp.]
MRRALNAATLLYLLVPNLLFLAGWVQPVVAGVVGILLLITTWYIWKHTAGEMAPWRGKDTLGLVVLALLCLGWVESIGLNGHVIQHNDFIVRNAIYDTLVRETWPITGAGGGYFSYYHAFWLVPAGLSKMIPWVDAAYWLYAWAYLGVLLGMLQLYVRWRWRAVLFLVLLALVGDVSIWYRHYIIPVMSKLSGADSPCTQWLLEHEVWFTFPYTDSWTHLRNMFNHIIPIWLLMSLLLARGLRPHHELCAASFVVLCSPLGALGTLPWLGWRMLPVLRQEGWRSLLNSPTMAACLYLPLPLLYLAANEGSHIFLSPCGIGTTEYATIGGLGWLAVYAVAAASILLPAWWLLPRRYRSTALFHSVYVVALLYPLVWVGTRHNELAMKASGVMWFGLVWLYTHAMWHTGWRYPWRWAVFLLLSAPMAGVCLVGVCIKSWSLEPKTVQEHIRGEWQGHLNHPQDPLYTSFRSRQPNPLLFRIPGH